MFDNNARTVTFPISTSNEGKALSKSVGQSIISYKMEITPFVAVAGYVHLKWFGIGFLAQFALSVSVAVYTSIVTFKFN